MDPRYCWNQKNLCFILGTLYSYNLTYYVIQKIYHEFFLKAYKAASSKTFWLAQWNRDNPNFKLDMNKANRWAKDYAKKKKAEKQMKEDSKLFLQD